jgi:hypothetical protein
MPEFRVSETAGTQGHFSPRLGFEILGTGSRASCWKHAFGMTRSAGMTMYASDDSIGSKDALA